MNTPMPYTLNHSEKEKKYYGFPCPDLQGNHHAPFPVPGCTGMEGQRQKTHDFP